jgi:hypothetical protein
MHDRVTAAIAARSSGPGSSSGPSTGIAWSVRLFAVAPGADRRTDLVASLCGSARPSLSSVLREKDVFVDLTIGSDVGYYDAITVASPTDLQLRIDALAIDYAERIEAYENSLGDLSDMTMFLRALRQLAGLTLDAG